MARRVLVIDDVPDILMLATLSLEAAGFIALTAHDGIEGIEVASTAWPDLILCDVHMPQIDGFEVLCALRANAATAGIPFILLTGDDTVEARLSELSVPPDGCLHKPFSHAELVHTVAAGLGEVA